MKKYSDTERERINIERESDEFVDRYWMEFQELWKCRVLLGLM